MHEVTTPVPTAILVLRAWLEGDPPTELRARLTTTAGTAEAERSLAVAASVDEVCDAVRKWLSAFAAESGDGAVTPR